MADSFNIDKRSSIMRSVKSKGNKSTEIGMIDYFKKNKITGWRRNYNLPGKPDFIFPKKKIALFADGCFWHGHDCRGLTPKSNKEYWTKKINRNKERDEEITKKLESMGWKVIRIWECKIPSLTYLF